MGGLRFWGLIFRVKMYIKKFVVYMVFRMSIINIWFKIKWVCVEGECGLGDEEEVFVFVIVICLGLFYFLWMVS